MAANDNENELDAKLRTAVERANADPDRRRSISIRGTTYEKLRDHCKAHNLTMSGVVEMLIVELIEKSERER